MKLRIILSLLLLGFVSQVLAYDDDSYAYTSGSTYFEPAFYIGAQGGYARADEGSALKQLADYIYGLGGTASKEVRQGGFGARGHLGYSIARFLAIETGYSYFAKNRYEASSYVSVDSNNLNIKVATWALDLVAKVILPINDFSIYGKAGAAYVNTQFNDDANNASYRHIAIRPTYGVGIGYNINNNISIDAVWSTIDGRSQINDMNAIDSKLDKVTPTCRLYTLGLTYKFIGF
jgi:hypothetical protein